MPIIAAFTMPHPPLLLPEIGKGEELKIPETAKACETCAKLIAGLKPDAIILASPHAQMYADTFYICEPSLVYENMDHGALVPLYFVNKYYTHYRLIRVSPSLLSLEEHYKFGKEIVSELKEMGDVRAVFIASGDLSHKLKEDGPYGFAQEGVEFDKIVTAALDKGDFNELMNIAPELTEKAAECGLRPFVMMAGALENVKFTSKLLSYENTFGVGYAVAQFVGLNI